MRLLRAAMLYFATVFALGFILGSVRVLLVAPLLGELPAVLAELPVMLTLSWICCGLVLRRYPPGPGIWTHLAMGGIALILLLGAELCVSVLGFGRTPAQHWASYRALTAQLGLAAQLGFALFPFLRSR